MRRAPLLVVILAAVAGLVAWLAWRDGAPTSHIASTDAVQAVSHAAPRPDLEDVPSADVARETPPAPLTLRVVDEHGDPVAGARILYGRPELIDTTVHYLTRSGGGRSPISGTVELRTDERGLARVAPGLLARADPGRKDTRDGTAFVVYASAHGPDFNDPRQARSEIVPISSDDRGELTLALRRPAVVHLRPEGPIALGSISLDVRPVKGTRSTVRPFSWRSADPRSGTFAVHEPGEYTAHAELQGGVAKAERRFRVDRLGQEFEVALTLDTEGLELALRGRVLQTGARLARSEELRVSIDGDRSVEFWTRGNGEFELWHAPGTEVLLSDLRADLHARFEPEELRVPFGTQGVVLRRLPDPPDASVRVAFVDAATGEALDAWLQWSVPDGERHRSRNTGWVHSGAWDGLVPAITGLELVAFARGYCDTVIPVFPSGFPRDEKTVELRVAMLRGFSREISIYDCNDRTGVAGARVLVEGRVVAVADERGIARVDLPAWPGTLEFQLEGFDPASWPPPWIEPTAARYARMCPAD